MRIVVVVVGLLLLDLIADIPGGGDVRLLHGDVHVISGDRLEHGLALIPRESLELHIGVIFLEGGISCPASRATGRT